MKKNYRYIYGPVSSWRLGSSLGVDPVYTGRGKICSFDCVYCQVGKTTCLTDKRKIYVPTEAIVSELEAFPRVEIDYITFSGRGEPTLAKNLGKMIDGTRRARKEKIAVITNSSLIDKKSVRDALLKSDFVLAKLDAHSENLFRSMNKPFKSIKFEKTINGLKKFRRKYKGRLAIQIMFLEKNKAFASRIAAIARSIKPDEIQLNTPLRPCAVKALTKKEMAAIKKIFSGITGKNIKVVNVYEAKKKEVKAVSAKATLKRRGKL